MLHPPKILQSLFPGMIWRIPNERNNIFLTFDDGPDPHVTPRVLDTLAKHNAKATFFCLGRNVEKYPDLFDRIKAEGHRVGNHTYSHLDGWRTRNKNYFKDIERANKIIRSNLFRPPYGRIKPSQIRVLKEKYKIVMWSWMFEDYKQKEISNKNFNKYMNKIQNGEILVFHDVTKTELDINLHLVKTLKFIQSLKYSSVTLTIYS